jgi:glycogen(starch) synthase
VRVLLVTTEYPPAPDMGGIGAYLASAAAALVEAGVEVHVLCCRPGDADTDERGPGGEWVHRRGASRRTTAVLGRLGLAPTLPLRLAARRLGRFDVVEAPDWEAAGLAFTFGLPWRRRPPLVLCLHTPTAIIRRHGGVAGNGLRERLERWSAARSAAVVTYSPLLVDELRRLGWFVGRTVELQAPCLERTLLDRPVAPPSVEPVVLGVGRLEHRKGFDLLVRAVGLLGPSVPGVRLVLVGRDVVGEDGRWGSEGLRALAETTGVRLELVPPMPRDELGVWYDLARVVAVPSRFESFSMVGLEALAHGRPVVCTPEVGFGAMAARSGPGSATAIAAEDPAALAEALRPYLVDDALAATAQADVASLLERMAGPAGFAERRLALYRAAIGD